MSVFATNRKARYDYDILKTFEVGVELLGTEVKSIRQGSVSLNGAYGIIKNRELWLLNADIAPFQVGNAPLGYERTKTRRLLINKPELMEIIKKINAEHLVLIPLSFYSKGNFIKLELSLARPKKAFDKRETIKKRDISREVERRLK